MMSVEGVPLDGGHAMRPGRLLTRPTTPEGSWLAPCENLTDLVRVAQGEVMHATRSSFVLLACVAALSFLLLFLVLADVAFRELGRKLDLPLPQPGVVMAQIPAARKLVVRIQTVGTPGRSTPAIVIGARVTKDWRQVRDEFRRLAQQDGATDLRVFVVPGDDALHGWVARVLDYLTELRFRNVHLCPAETPTPAK